LRHAIHWFQANALVVAFSRWRAIVIALQQQKERLANILAQWQYGKQRQRFRRWRTFVAQCQHQREQEGTATQSYRRRVQRRHFRQWRNQVWHQKLLKSKMLDLLDVRTQGRMTSSFHRWRHFITTKKRLRKSFARYGTLQVLMRSRPGIPRIDIHIYIHIDEQNIKIVSSVKCDDTQDNQGHMTFSWHADISISIYRLTSILDG
jgi:hypothetical protein